MPDTTWINILGGAGVAGVWLMTILFGYMYPKTFVDELKARIQQLETTVEIERSRADTERARADAASLEAAKTGNLLMTVLQPKAVHSEVES